MIARSSFSHSGFGCRRAVPDDKQNRGWPRQPLMSIDGRVAESSRVPHKKLVPLFRVYANLGKKRWPVAKSEERVDYLGMGDYDQEDG